MTGDGTRLERAADWTLGLVSPRRLAFRRHWRRMAADDYYRETWLAVLRTQGYRSAKQGTGKAPWMGGAESADAAILGDLPALRNRSRELNRDDPLASGLTRTFVMNVVGPGIRAQARTGDPKKNGRLESVWAERKDDLSRADGLTHGESQRLLVGKVIEDGEVFRKRTVSAAGEPVWFETIEADRVATPVGQTGAKRDIRDGIERDADGVPNFYWVAKHHPGDFYIGPGGKVDRTYARVPASDIRHLKVTERPGQTRGVPMLHAVLQDLRDLDLLMLASLKRVQISACLAVFLKSGVSAEDMLGDMTKQTAKKEGYVLDQQIEPGMIFKLYGGEEAQMLLPNFPTPELSPFIIMLARRIGAALGVSWQIVLKDFSESNYSSARTDLLESRQVYTVLQRWFIEKSLNWEWAVVMEDARFRGDARVQGMTDEELRAVHWIAPGWKWIDPQKEAVATRIKLLDIGSTTFQEVCAADGKDWEEVIAQRQLEDARLREAGLPTLTDLMLSRRGSATGAEKAAPASVVVAQLLEGRDGGEEGLNHGEHGDTERID